MQQYLIHGRSKQLHQTPTLYSNLKERPTNKTNEILEDHNIKSLTQFKLKSTTCKK